MIVSARSMPSERSASKPPRAMSSTDRSGKLMRYGAPVAGLIDAGPVEPKQLPSEFTQMTNQRLVSMERPGPIIAFPPAFARVLLATICACAGGERPVNSRMALLRSAFSSPQVSYATRAPCSTPPRHIGNGSGSGA